MASQLGVGCPSAAPLHFAQMLSWQAFGQPAGHPPSNSACQARVANYVPTHLFYRHLSEVLPGGPENDFAQTSTSIYIIHNALYIIDSIHYTLRVVRYTYTYTYTYTSTCACTIYIHMYIGHRRGLRFLRGQATAQTNQQIERFCHPGPVSIGGLRGHTRQGFQGEA